MTGSHEGQPDLRRAVRRRIAPLLPSSWRDDPLADDLDLLDDGIGLDSSGLLEVLIACEDEFDVALPAETLLERPEFRMGDLVDAVVDAVDRRPPS